MTILLFFFTCPAHAIVPPKSVTVLADDSMGVAMAEIARAYSRDHQTIVNASFAPPKAQEMQITEGAAADILITPRHDWIEQLKTRGLIDVHSPAPVAKNRLALAGPANTPVEMKTLQSFPTAYIIHQLREEPGFVMGNPETLLEGSYSKEALRAMGAMADLEPYTLYIKQIGEMLEMVEKHDSYGLFFYSTVAHRDDVHVIGLLPERTHRPIIYYAVVVAGDNMNEARKFLDYLKSADARQLFKENGFVVD